MGKAKKRLFNKTKLEPISCMKREQAIEAIVLAIKNKMLTPDIENIIDLFGITKEELSEYGVKYEDLKTVFSML